eukprot:10357996-Karenia_brevis.AAC.1
MGSLCAAFSSVSDGRCQGCADPSGGSEEPWELGGLGEESEEEDKPEPEHRQPGMQIPDSCGHGLRRSIEK